MKDEECEEKIAGREKEKLGKQDRFGDRYERV